MRTTAYVALGSNMGDRQGFIARAIKLMGTTPGILVSRETRLKETKPIGPIKQPNFINGVAKIETLLGPTELLDALLAVERQLGRVRKERWGPRTIDLDILLYGDRVIDHPRLRVPHPEIKNRPFIMEALRDLQRING
jgi:2-amino-4-hydroxy-6-hydroxymethyldihydropteridine diphosphokinase